MVKNDLPALPLGSEYSVSQPRTPQPIAWAISFVFLLPMLVQTQSAYAQSTPAQSTASEPKPQKVAQKMPEKKC